MQVVRDRGYDEDAYIELRECPHDILGRDRLVKRHPAWSHDLCQSLELVHILVFEQHEMQAVPPVAPGDGLDHGFGVSSFACYTMVDDFYVVRVNCSARDFSPFRCTQNHDRMQMKPFPVSLSDERGHGRGCIHPGSVFLQDIGNHPGIEHPEVSTFILPRGILVEIEHQPRIVESCSFGRHRQRLPVVGVVCIVGALGGAGQGGIMDPSASEAIRKLVCLGDDESEIPCGFCDDGPCLVPDA
ncbi:MAG: hypothetical protein BWZ01_02952 [Deltaproteobacteria bacterium ADurb.BinA179]|nr:MAG: hypothetical protein BWZ01_02952 [Deltaproteobacteria bacterium ADurb.BinA179]